MNILFFQFGFDIMHINSDHIIRYFGRAIDRGFYRDIISNIYQTVAGATTMIRSHGRQDLLPGLIENTNHFPIQYGHFTLARATTNDEPEFIFPVMDIDIDNEEDIQISRDLWNNPPSFTEILDRIRMIWKKPVNPFTYFYLLSATVVILALIKTRKNTNGIVLML